MKVTVKDFLAHPWEGDLPFSYEDPADPTIPGLSTPTKLQVLSCLWYRNGGRFRVSSWGVIQSGGLYGSEGLDQNEALALLSISSYLHGLMDGSDEGEQQFKDLVDSIHAEHDRVATLRNYKEEPKNQAI